MIKEYVLIISFVLTVGLWISLGVGNANLTAMLGLFTVSMFWLHQWLEFKGEKEEEGDKK